MTNNHVKQLPKPSNYQYPQEAGHMTMTVKVFSLNL